MKTILPLIAAVLCFMTACSTRGPENQRSVSMRGPIPEATPVLAKSERPGLGTAWGEPRESWVEPAYFARAWEDRPSGAEKVFYNDREGIEAMMAYIGVSGWVVLAGRSLK